MKRFELALIVILSMGAGIGWHSLMVELGALTVNVPCQQQTEIKK